MITIRRKQEEMLEAQRRLEEQRHEEEAWALADERRRKERLHAYLAKEGFKSGNKKKKTGMLWNALPFHISLARSCQGQQR